MTSPKTSPMTSPMTEPAASPASSPAASPAAPRRARRRAGAGVRLEDDEGCWTLRFRAREPASGALRFTVRRARGRRGHVLAFQPGEKLLLNVFRRGERAPSDCVEAFVEYFQPRDTCGAVDVASGVLQLAAHAVLEDHVLAAGATW